MDTRQLIGYVAWAVIVLAILAVIDRYRTK